MQSNLFLADNIAFVAGRSAGHLLPAITLAKKYKKNNQILFFTTTSALDKKIIQQEKEIIDKHIPLYLLNIPYNQPWKLPIFFLYFLKTLFKSFYTLHKNKTKKVISTGSYISLPVCLAAWLLGIPIELYELNAYPGKATRLLGHFANRINLCFSQAIKHFPIKKTKIISYPLYITKKEFINLPQTFCKNRRTILVLGGSQGSRTLNKLIIIWAEKTKQYHNDIQIIHQTGSTDLDVCKKFYASFSKIPTYIFSYTDSLSSLYKKADIIICRSGAGTLFEVLHSGKNCITIPLQTKTTTHQHNNALAMQQKYPTLFTLVSEKNFEALLKKFSEVMRHKLKMLVKNR